MIEPADAVDADGHQVVLSEGAQIIVTVTSADGSRVRVYRVTIEIGNQAPQATALPPLRLTADGEPAHLRLARYFNDPDGDPLSYTLGQVSDPGVAEAAVSNGILSVTPIGPGTANLTVSPATAR